MSKSKKHAFKTEVSQLLDLMIHSLYSNKEIFLRELISNASDALDKLRFSALSNNDLLEKDSKFGIQIIPNKTKKTLVISDNGIGMNEVEVLANIGTIASSGTKMFLDQLKAEEARDSNLIGQFGVGFYSTFMVAEKVEIHTRRAGDSPDQGVRWVSKGDGEFTLADKAKATRGTTITLKIKDECSEFLDLFKLKSIVHRYSEHINFPVQLPKEADKKPLETVNKAEALWTKNPKEVSDEDYQGFYKMVATDWENPLSWIHSRVEGTTEYTALLFIPNRAPFDLYERDQKQGVKLYVKRVFIMEDPSTLLPNYLRFIRGIVDCPDLPLNVSREILQDSRIIKRIRSGLVKKILDKIEALAKDNGEAFATLIQTFGKVLKEGIIEDADNKERIAKILRFDSINHSDLSLDEYLKNRIEGQDDIYFLSADSKTSALNSPHLEVFKERNIDVLLLSDKIDEWVTTHLTEYDGKKLQAANQAGLVLPGDKKPDESEDKDKEQSADEVHQGLLDAVKEALGDRVKEVRISNRLRQYPACVISADGEMNHHMQQILKQMGQEMNEIKPVLEINPEHKLIQHIEKHTGDENFSEWSNLLLDQALLSEGASLPNPGEFVRRMNALFAQLIK